MTSTLGLLEGSRRHSLSLARPVASSSSYLLAQMVDQWAFAPVSGSEGPLEAAMNASSDFATAITRLSSTQRLGLEARFGRAGVEELSALAHERDPEQLQEALFGFAQRQEAAGRLEAAAAMYASLSTGEASPSIATRARQHLDAILGRGAVAPRAEFLMRRLAQEATEPSTLIAMTAAGALFRVTRLAALSRLAGSPSANFLTRGLGARAIAGFAGFAVEAPAFTLSGRLAGLALGRSEDLSLRALGRDVASGYLLLGGLRVAGFAGASAYQRLGSGNAFARGIFTQGSMLTGILGAHWMEQRLGLRPELPGSTTFVDSLAMLLQFHVAGNLGHHAFGERVAAWERGLEFRTELLARSNPRPRPPVGNGLSIGPEPALAVVGNADERAPNRPVEDLLGGLQVFMSKMDEGGMGKGLEGRAPGRESPGGSVDPNRLDREIANLLLTAKDNLDQGLQVFLESLPMAAAIAHVQRGNKDFGRIYIANRRFTELFGYSVAEANEHNITHFFNKLSLPGIMLRIFEIIGGGIFSPTNMDFRHRDGHYIKIRGSGVIRPVHGRTIAFGFYEPRELGEAADRAQNQVLGALASVGREQPLRSNEGAFEVRSVSELSGHLTRPNSPLLQQAQAQDLRITVTDMPWVQSPEGYGDSLVRYFNIQSRKMEFPAGRRIVVEFPATDTRARCAITLIKFMEEFRILGAGETDSGHGNGTSAELANGANSPTLVPRAARPETPVTEGGTSSNGHTPDARTAASLERLQSELGSAMDRVRERVTREDVELGLQEEFEAAFLEQSVELIQRELQALTQGRIKIPLGRQIAVVVSTDRGPRRLVFKKVLLNFERLE